MVKVNKPIPKALFLGGRYVTEGEVDKPNFSLTSYRMEIEMI